MRVERYAWPAGQSLAASARGLLADAAAVRSADQARQTVEAVARSLQRLPPAAAQDTAVVADRRRTRDALMDTMEALLDGKCCSGSCICAL